MKRILAAAAMLALGTACRTSALASGNTANPRSARVALCASAHAVPHVLMKYHRMRIGRTHAILMLRQVRDAIEENASGRYEADLHNVAAALYVYEVATLHRGDTGGAYRDLRAVREPLPRPACSREMLQGLFKSG